MRARTLLIPVIVLGGAGFAAWWFLGGSSEEVSFRTAAVERRDVLAVVSATGTLTPVVTVDVGTQVTGRIAELLVDFNDVVQQGQVLARLDTSLLDLAVASSRAQKGVAAANRAQAELELARVEALHAQGAATNQALEQARTTLTIARASETSAGVAVRRAVQDLSYATITSPVSGLVIARSVDVGQTVNAGTSAPTLFQVAGDLTRMQILASVDEADIGQIAEGQPVKFTVQAYPDDSFTGSVRQVRFQATTVENVTTYTAVIDVPNDDRRLLPGMSATVDVVVAEEDAALCVADAALRYRPDAEFVSPAMAEAAAARAAGRGAGGEAGGRGGPGGGRTRDPTRGAVWVAGDDGLLTRVRVTRGLSDGTCTVIGGDTVTEGMVVVTGIDRTGGAAASSTSSSPFQQQPAPRRRPGGF